MHRPLRVPFHLRVWHLIRGLLFYNTVYWRRASDGLNMTSLSAEERARQRPERNLEIIKPRVRPRPTVTGHVEITRGAEVSDPRGLAPSVDFAETAENEAAESGGSASHHARPRPERAEDGTEQVYVKRRRYRRRLVSGGSAIDRGSFLARVFGKK